MSSRVRHLLIATAFLLPACVVRLSDRNAPLPNGGVTGAPADCSKVTPLPRSAPGGEPAPRLVGRYDVTDPAGPSFDASGNWLEARFEGTRVAVRLDVPDYNKDVIFTAEIDDRPPFQLTATGALVNGAKQTVYVLATDLPQGPHVVRVHRDTEASAGGVATFLGFDVSPGKLLPPLQRQRRIEVIGDSITCGYGNMGQNATCPFDVKVREQVGADGKSPNVDPETNVAEEVRVPVTESQYLAYGSIVGRALDADVTTVCWSGKGVVINYRETDDTGAPLLDATKVMPDVWERTILSDVENAVPWDFSKEPEPQVVVVNLGTNDFTRDEEQPRGVNDGIDLPRFRSGYLAFIELVRKRRPNAHIFLAVPPMVTDTFPLDNARRDFADSLRGVVQAFEARGDTKVYVIDLVEQGTRYGLGCDYHPNLRVHEIMAEQVAGAIRSKTCW